MYQVKPNRHHEINTCAQTNFLASESGEKKQQLTDQKQQQKTQKKEENQTRAE